MSKGNGIVVSSNPKGVFLEGTIQDTSKPGTVMQMEAATAFISGRPNWIHANLGADGDPALIALLVEDSLQGQLMTTAYTSGTRCFLYCPVAGEEVNVLLDEGAGTSNTITQGDRFMMDSDTGIPIPESGSPRSVPFIAMETLTQQAAPVLTWCTYTGH